MALPALLHADKIPLVPTDASGTVERRTLAFSMQPQQRDHWCWAAAAVSVAAFYGPGTDWTQCRLADAELGRLDCCGTGAEGPCNRPWYLHTSLARVGRFNDWIGTSSSFETVVTEIDAGNPLCLRTEWGDGTAHFLALVGYIKAGGDITDDFVFVSDPLYGESRSLYSEFRDGYRDIGTWTDSYRCK